MNLKEAFAYRAFLEQRLREISSMAAYAPSFNVITEHHFRTKANPDAEDEVLSSKDGTLSSMIPDSSWATMDPQVAIDTSDLISKLICELDRAIMKAKVEAATTPDRHVDVQISTNKVLREELSFLKRLSGMRSVERKDFGTAYKIDNDGKQAAYQYPVKVVGTIDFDRNKVKRRMNDLEDEINERAFAIDALMLEIKVDFDPPFRTSDTLRDIFETVAR